MRSARFYRALTYLYPPRFRREYGGPMAQLFADRVRRDGAWRAWRRSALDVAISAPYEHWENFVNGSPQTKLVAAAVVTGAAATAFILVGGALVGFALLVVLAWQLYSMQRMRGAAHASSRRWWKLALGGVGLFALLFVVFAVPWPEDWRSAVPGDVAWVVAMAGFCTALVLVVLGLFMGFAQWVAHRGSRSAV
jgi:hypothetical protein